jgi:triphosphoribosyl-dephospho-CoA synthase CitG
VAEALLPNTRCVGEAASRAMREEVRLSPKPGLVDSFDSGVHRDMDLALFLKSAASLESYFREVAREGIGGETALLLSRLRPLGIRAEKTMFAATGGINTHKGQIFSLGVCTAAAVRVSSADEILGEAGRICRGLKGELVRSRSRNRGLSHGERIFRDTGTTGIRGEAEEGFPAVSLHSLPACRKALDEGAGRDEAALEALLALMAVVTDSNVLHRRGWEGLSLMRAEAEEFLSRGGMRQSGAVGKLQVMNRLFIRENISPGGCADLLALTLFLTGAEAFYGR